MLTGWEAAGLPKAELNPQLKLMGTDWLSKEITSDRRGLGGVAMFRDVRYRFFIRSYSVSGFIVEERPSTSLLRTCNCQLTGANEPANGNGAARRTFPEHTQT